MNTPIQNFLSATAAFSQLVFQGKSFSSDLAAYRQAAEQIHAAALGLQTEGVPLATRAEDLEGLIQGLNNPRSGQELRQTVRKLEFEVRRFVADRLVATDDESLRRATLTPTTALPEGLRVNEAGLAMAPVAQARSLEDIQRYLDLYGDANFNLRQQLRDRGVSFLGALPPVVADRVRVLAGRALRVVHWEQFGSLSVDAMKRGVVLGEPNLAALQVFEGWRQVAMPQLDMASALVVFESFAGHVGTVGAEDRPGVIAALQRARDLVFVGYGEDHEPITKEQLIALLEAGEAVSNVLQGFHPLFQPRARVVTVEKIVERRVEVPAPQHDLSEELELARSQRDEFRTRLRIAQKAQHIEYQLREVSEFILDAMSQSLRTRSEEPGDPKELLDLQQELDLTVKEGVYAIYASEIEVAQAANVWDPQFIPVGIRFEGEAVRLLKPIRKATQPRILMMRDAVTVALNIDQRHALRQERGELRSEDIQERYVRVKAGDVLVVHDKVSHDEVARFEVTYDVTQKLFRILEVVAPVEEPVATSEPVTVGAQAVGVHEDLPEAAPLAPIEPLLVEEALVAPEAVAPEAPPVEVEAPIAPLAPDFGAFGAPRLEKGMIVMSLVGADGSVQPEREYAPGLARRLAANVDRTIAQAGLDTTKAAQLRAVVAAAQQLLESH